MNACRRTFLACCWATLSACAGLPDAAPPVPRHAEVNGVKLAVVEQGRGTPVVFVHGAISDWRTWESQRPAFAAKHRYIAYSQRYFGTDPWPDDGRAFSATTHAADLAALIRSLNAGPVHLVGWSYGGAVISVLAAEHPQLVRSISIHEPVIRPLLADSAEGRQVSADFGKAAGPAGAAVKAGDNALAAKLFLELVYDLPRGGFESDAVTPRHVVLDNARTVPLGMTAYAQPQLVCADLGRIRTPTLVTVGANTNPFFKAVTEAYVRCIPGSRLVSLANSNHDAPQRVPADFNRTVLEFIGGVN